MIAERKIDRFTKYMIFKGLNDNKVTLDLGLSIGTIGKSRKEGRDLSERNVIKILNFYTDLERVWLLTGEGEMLANPTEQDKVLIASNNTYGDNASGNNNVTINNNAPRAEKRETGAGAQLRPVVTKELASRPDTDVYMIVKDGAAGNLNTMASIPPYNNFDFYYQVRQDAMEPLYRQGEVVALAHLEPNADIIQGAAMVVDTKDFGFVLRNVYDRGDYYECRCVNKDSKFESQDIRKEKVIRLYRIVYTVRLGD